MADQMTNEVIDQETAEAQMVEVVQPAIEKLIYVIRDKQVMIPVSTDRKRNREFEVANCDLNKK